MNTLRRALDLHRGNDTEGEISHLCYATRVQALTLQVETCVLTRWVFPWMHFVYARLQITDLSDQLVLTFVRHALELRGRNLEKLAAAAANITLARINVLPGDYREVSAEQAFIDSIEIHLLSSPDQK